MGERSKLPFEHHPGCMESLFHFLDLQHHLHLPKMIGYKKPSIKVQKIKQNGSCTGELCSIAKDSSLSSGSPTESPTKSPTKSPRKILAKSFKSKKNLRNNKGHKRSISSLSPIASRLMRTMSIHHLKCHDFVPSASSSERSCNVTCQECGSVSPLNAVDQVHHSKDLVDFLQLFHANKDVFMKIVRNPYVLLAKESHGENISSSNKEIGLNKCMSFPRPSLPRAEEPGSFVSRRFKSVKSNMKKVINEKEVARITNDGFLHKVPCGKKETEWKKSNNYTKEINQNQMRRSSSLTESLDEYSNLFESISKCESSKLTRNLSLKRIHSLPEMRFYLPPSSPSLTTTNDDESLLSSQIGSADSDFEEETCDNSPLSSSDIKQEQTDPIIESESGPDPHQLDITSHYNIQVDETDEAYFFFIKDTLTRSGLTGSDTLTGEQPILDPLFIEPESDSGPDQLLMFDLINEVLLDIYNSSLFKSLPTGDKMIEEVWMRFKKYLNLCVEIKVENVVKNDFAKKNDSWMNLNFESECVGLDLEDLILEDLIDEILFD